MWSFLVGVLVARGELLTGGAMHQQTEIPVPAWPNDSGVIVTPPGHGLAMSPRTPLIGGRAATQVAAARPHGTNQLPTLLDHVVADLVNADRDPTRALAAAGRACRETTWASYKTGRNRVATMAACYLRWLAPPESWTPAGTLAVGDRTVFLWADDGELIADVLAVGDQDVRDVVAAAFDGADGALDAVRAVRVNSPTTSTLHTHEMNVARLVETPYWFEGDR